MPELVEQMYCSQQIVIPPKFPFLLKKYCKAAIKTQPYDLLRWSFEYFKALAENRRPPVKLRLEYPVYSSEGGLTRGCLKVLAHQLAGMIDVPIPLVKRAWQGFCLDTIELVRILCLCEVYLREESVPFLNFIAVAGGMLTKCLTNTMILLCETLTKEPDGGSAAIPAKDFLKMYRFLASIDASTDVKYYAGYREGHQPTPEEEEQSSSSESDIVSHSTDSFWQESTCLRHVSILDDKVAESAKISTKATKPLIGVIPRSPSVERDTKIERENYLSDRAGRPAPNVDIDKHLQKMSAQHLAGESPPEYVDKSKEEKVKAKTTEDDKKDVKIVVYDENGKQIEFEFYGEPVIKEESLEEAIPEPAADKTDEEEKPEETEIEDKTTEDERVAAKLTDILAERQRRLMKHNEVLDELDAIVDKCNAKTYDLGMIAGRQMSTTSGEFIVQHIERDILAYIDEQIAILPDPDLKKKKAKPEEVEMVRGIVENFIDENMALFVPEIEEVEEEEEPIPEITVVYAVPGIGPVVDHDIVMDFIDYAKEVSKEIDVIMPRHLRHYLCPPLEKYVETYDKYKEDNEIPTSKDKGTPHSAVDLPAAAWSCAVWCSLSNKTRFIRNSRQASVKVPSIICSLCGRCRLPSLHLKNQKTRTATPITQVKVAALSHSIKENCSNYNFISEIDLVQ